MPHGRPPLLTGLLGLALLGGCATLGQIAALRHVDFRIEGVSDLRLAGIDLQGVASFDDLGLADGGRLAVAVGRRDVPLSFRLHVEATNPDDNRTTARLVGMDWTLLLQERETLSGAFENEVLLPPGEPTDVPIAISLDLLDFFEANARDLVELALSLAGQGGAPKEVALRATPVVETPLGPIRYPQPITIVSREVGGAGAR